MSNQCCRGIVASSGGGLSPFSFFYASLFIGSVGAPAVVENELERVTFAVSGALLGQSALTLEFELDGPTGSTLEVDNVFFPDLVNGTFESGGLAGWQAVSSGAGVVEVVPEPSATLALLACGVVLVLLRRGAPMRGPEFTGRC